MPKRLFISILFLFIFTISWSNAFVLGRNFPIYLAFSFLLFFISPFYLHKFKYLPKNLFGVNDLFLLFFLTSILISSLFNVNSKTSNYLLAYFTVFVFKYLLIKIWFTKTTTIQILKINYYGVLFVAIFVLIEVPFHSFFNINPQIYHYPHVLKDAILYAFAPGVYIYRGFGLAIEPTYLSYYFNTLGMLAIYYSIYYQKKSTLSILVIFAANFLTFSIGGFIFLIISFFAVVILIIGKTQKIKVRHIIVFIFFTLVLLTIGLSIYEYIERLFVKINFWDAEFTGSGRLTYIKNSLALMGDFDYLTGIGLGGLSDIGYVSPTNLYVFIFVESGIVSLVLFILFLIFSIPNKLNVRKPFFAFALIGFFAGVLHFNIMSTFYHPALWVLIAIMDKETKYNSIPSHPPKL